MDFDPNALPVPDLGLCCMQCSYALRGLPSHRCPECGREFTLNEYIPRGDFPVVIRNGREVVLDSTKAEIMRRAGILHMVHQIPAEAIFGIGSTHARDGKLAVERGRYFEAIHLLNQFEQTGEMPPERSPSGVDWTCASCGEENPGTFDVCWSCSAEHNSPRD